MSDELDPELRRWFAAAEQSLHDEEFTARLRLNRRRRRTIDAAARIGAAISASLANALLSPWRLRPALAGVAASVAIALALGLAGQG